MTRDVYLPYWNDRPRLDAANKSPHKLITAEPGSWDHTLQMIVIPIPALKDIDYDNLAVLFYYPTFRINLLL